MTEPKTYRQLLREADGGRANYPVPMRITVIKRNGYWVADMDGLPGSPPIGTGSTQVMAVACLFSRLLADETWLQYARELKGQLYVNGKLWADIPGASRR